jgi:peptidyl-prolyl cis-trans isomerase SurA
MKFRLQIALLVFVLDSSPMLAQTGTPRASKPGTPLLSAHVRTIPPARPVARVNGSVLTDHDLLREMYAIFPYARQHNGTFPKTMEADIRRGALKMIEFEELVYQEALRQHMTISPRRTERARAQFRKQFDSAQQYSAFLQIEFDGSTKALDAKIRRSLLIEALLKSDIYDKSVGTVAQAKAYYAQHPKRFEVPETYSLQAITALPPENPTPAQLEQVRARAESALRQAQATKSYEEFGILAEKVSQDDYRVMMGDHQAADAAQLPPPILQTASRLQPGQISGLVQVGQAFTIIRLNAHNPAHKEAFSKVKDSLRLELQQEKVERLRSALNQRLRKNARIEEL